MTTLLLTIQSFDSAISNFFTTLRTPLLTEIVKFITIFGSTPVAIIITLIGAAIIYKIYGSKKYLYPLLITSMGTGLTTYIAKNIFQRARPLDALITEKSFSFPSGHALIAITLFGLLTYLIQHALANKNSPKKQTLRKVTITLGTLLILLIGISRLYLGVHYATDVLGGYLIGSLWLIMGITLINHQSK